MLGLGAMGRRMARRLLDAGHELTVWNRTLGAADELVAAGARSAPTPRAAADGAQIVWAMVFDDVASRRVWLAPADGAAAALAPGAMAVESSTLSLAWVHELAADLARRGVNFVDAPVSGSRPQAQAGQIIFTAGGDAAVLERLRPLLMTLGTSAHHLGAVGSGTMFKLAVNALFATQVAVLAELLAFLQRGGLDAARALEALRTMPVLSPAAAGAGTLMLIGDYTPQAPVDLIAKDLGYAIDAAESASVALPLTAATQRRFEAARIAGLGAENLVAITKLYR
jgi:3-hydroxyisobutyrate dehydrogenase-like beta-hydroxyacid dehydrogenase